MGLTNSPLSAVERGLGPPYAFPDVLKQLGPNEINLPLAWDTLNASQHEFQASKMAVHAAMVDRMDREIGRVIAQLREMGAMDNTLIFFLSDNGAGRNDGAWRRPRSTRRVRHRRNLHQPRPRLVHACKHTLPSPQDLGA